MVAERELFFHKNDHANFSGGKTYNEAFWIDCINKVLKSKSFLGVQRSVLISLTGRKPDILSKSLNTFVFPVAIVVKRYRV